MPKKKAYLITDDSSGIAICTQKNLAENITSILKAGDVMSYPLWENFEDLPSYLQKLVRSKQDMVIRNISSLIGQLVEVLIEDENNEKVSKITERIRDLISVLPQGIDGKLEKQFQNILHSI